MTGGIYDYLLIIGIFYSFIQGMTNAWLLHNIVNTDTLGDFTEAQPGKLSRPRESSERNY